MKQFFSFAGKEFRHIFRDRRTILILLGMPVVQIILFGFAISTEVKNVQMAVLDPSPDMTTRQIIDRLDASEYFTLTRILHSSDEIKECFRTGDADMVIVFSTQFGNNLPTGEARIQIITDATDPNTAVMQANYARSIIAGNPSGQAEIKLLYNPQMKSAYNFVPGVMGLILMLICAMMTAISIVREKETGTMEVLLASPIRPIFIILAKAVPYLLLSCINLATILLLSVYVLEVPVEGSLFWLGILSVIFIIVALALGLLISTLVQTQVAAMLISGMAMMMPVMLLSGMIFPTENMPVILQWISDCIPAKWYIAAVKKVMIEGLGVNYILKELCILSLMGIALVTFSLKKFKIRL